ncbi:GNAT family N-acetyltransferase [Streptomyces sp. NPDC000410]|uniref:GNAT family N-acetyltransferase n=1 Tax=Streptomyces sp. NPDC000410 TaxID=3154254 RepID=UPI00331EB649
MSPPETGLVVREHRELDFLDEDTAWLDRPGFYSSRRWTRSQEGDRGFDTRYLTSHDRESGRLLGLVPYHRLSGGDSNPLYNEATVLAGASGVQVLAGSRTGYDNRILLHPDCTPSERAAMLAAFTERLLERAREAGAGHVTWWYLPVEDTQELVRLTGYATATTPCLPSAVIELKGGLFDEHVAGLTASRRSLVRRDLRRLSAAGYRSRTIPAELDTIERYAPLVVQVQVRHGEDLSHEGAVRYLRRCLSFGLGRDAIVTEVLDARDQLVAFSLGIVDGGTLHLRVFGCDYASGHGRSGEYFEATVYGPMRHALSRGLGAVHLGVTSYRAKSLRGARLRERRVVVVAPSSRELPALGADWGFLGDDERFLGGRPPEVAPC